MHQIIYFISLPFIWIISRIPFRIFYLISNGIYYLLYYVIGYRKKVVRYNLETVFPEKEMKEIIKIEKKFYRHFVDIFVEMIKSFSVSQKTIEKRYKYVNPEVIQNLPNSNKSIALVGAHYGNWEWTFNMKSAFKDIQPVGAYTRITNPFFDKFVKRNRTRFGTEFVQTNKTIQKMIDNKKNNIRSIYGLLSDQSPHISKTHYIAPFFNQMVPIHTGAEMLAKKYDFSVVYMQVERVKRGHYEVHFELLTDDAKSYENYQITDMLLERIEKQVRNEPAYYFWTHKRFKYKDQIPEDKPNLFIKKAAQ